MKTAELRALFLDYFKQQGHEIVRSSPLIPGDDATLLFTNAGMVQFKEVFLGQDKRAYSRATTVQRCVRAGGKHNDLDNVGYTARHHTFFEMLGNFSFGDYFKREAIRFAWEFLTDVLKLPKERLWVTVYKDDAEAEDIWLKEMNIDPSRFSRCDKDNFWEMGDTGPCGPCSEIFYDHGPAIAGGPPGSATADGDRYIEIWNLVFMQFNRGGDGKLTPIPKPCVDTGMGLERLAAVVQQVHANYEIDLFQALLKAAACILKVSDHQVPSLCVIADHIRSTSFLILDGVLPANEGRGYVLRRIIRRAIRHGNKFNISEPFFYRLVASLVAEMGDAYPELREAQRHIERVLLQEEEQFNRTLDQGLKILEQSIDSLSDKIIPGEVIFKLYDTYGFPPDLTGDIARERDLKLDEAGFELCMQAQRQQSKAASQFNIDYSKSLQSDTQTEFKGYETLQHRSKVMELFHEHESVQVLKTNQAGLIILDVSPFYAESGGQVGDQGIIQQGQAIFVVEDTYKEGSAHFHRGYVQQGEIQVHAAVDTQVNLEKRASTMRNHSATHLLHAALRQILGKHVMQKGSLVASDRLRFDFTHTASVPLEALRNIEQLVNQKILENVQVHTDLMTPENAKQAGAMALFGEKYGDQVRVLTMGEFSKELCGGTHVQATGDIGLFKITMESGIAAGIRRIEAVTGQGALLYVQQTETQLLDMAAALKTSRDQVSNKVSQLLIKLRDLERDHQQLKLKLVQAKGSDLTEQAVPVGSFHVLATTLDHADLKTLREAMDRVRQQLKPAIVVLASVEATDRVHLLASVSNDLTQQIKAGDVVNYVATQIGGKGGGRPDLAQAGGNDAHALPQALKSVVPWIKEKLGL